LNTGGGLKTMGKKSRALLTNPDASGNPGVQMGGFGLIKNQFL